MKTIVITGGTSGIGEALAIAYLNRGDKVIVVGPDPEKGKKYLRAAADNGHEGRAEFIAADLSLVEENRRVIDRLNTSVKAIDVLVLCARYFRSNRAVTAEGFEHNFALYYLSRFLLSYGLAKRMESARTPVVLNIAGPGVGPQEIAWNDLGLERGYDGWAAMGQGGRLNDLLGVSFAAKGFRTRYVLWFPGGTRTGFAGEFDRATAALVERMKRSGQPVETTVPPILRTLDDPPSEPLSAFIEGNRISLDLPSFDSSKATRLQTLTHQIAQLSTDC
ncbi:SDR family NAD(P)-dependent oxidoreductase [Rhodococcus sp. IEGM 1330]|uniref:SDR family NAD(P)-dependent oxidoreductase n=1 Tax=Rhodococcus sp. IEGM 1330 TaxID=3082225 RepID=UPI002954B053|nr:SDR family NAD(P)-dependent oxidoreductase [Rhodococcus sp. IEGM 1330]MDV8022197.1 SDR family NAD(P)-dependent oxidoreductase [Rhodococcus sp. IEGM 1330]